MLTRTRSWRVALLLVLLVLLSVGCSGSPPDALGSGDVEQTALAQEFVVWLSATDPLVTEHTQWHLGDPGTPGARQYPQSGAEFMRFHRDFLHRLRQKFESLGRKEDITPWYKLPPEMKNPNNGWNAQLADAESNIFNNIDPSTGGPFADLESYGFYVELNYHNWLHGIAKNAYGENAIGPINMSPTSTYFFKIHGLIEWLFQRFQRGDFSDDGQSDLVYHEGISGNTGLSLVAGGQIAEEGASLPDFPISGGCTWDPIGVTDVNLDGYNDIIFLHVGSGCKGVSVWYVKDAQVIGGVDSWSGLPLSGTGFKLVGTGDFNHDSRPDLLWLDTSKTPLTFVVWFMSGGHVKSTSTISNLPFSTFPKAEAIGVADYNDDGNPDILWKDTSQSDSTHWQPVIQYMNGLTTQSVSRQSIQISRQIIPGAIGNFSGSTGRIYDGDIVARPPTSCPGGQPQCNYTKYLWSPTTHFTAATLYFGAPAPQGTQTIYAPH